MDSVHPAHRCTSPLGVVPVGWGDGVGLCRGAASFPENGSFISLGFFLGDKLCLFFRSMAFMLVLLLNMLVAKREPHATMMHIRWVSLKGKSGQNHCKTTVSPVINVFFWLVNELFIFSGGWWYGCCILVGLGILGLVGRSSFLVSYLSSSPTLVGG